MLGVPLSPVPSQTLQVVLDGQNVQLSVYQLATRTWLPGAGYVGDAPLFMDISLGGVAVATCRSCLNGVRILLDEQYSSFVGDFLIVDTQGNTDPVYTGLGSRYQLVYLEASDLGESSTGTVITPTPPAPSPPTNPMIYYPQTPAEAAAFVTPVYYFYEPGDVRRYGVTGIGDETAKLQNALSVQQDVFIIGGLTVNTTAAVTMLSNQTLYGFGFESRISCNGILTNAININGQTRAIVRDLFVKCVSTFASGLDSAAILVEGGSQFCEFRDNRLEGTRAGITIYSGDYNYISGNQITSASAADACWDIGVYGNGSHNRIIGNACNGGIGTGSSSLETIGIQIFVSGASAKGDYNIIANNEIGTHTAYGILVYVNVGAGASSSNNTIVANHVHDITGTYTGGAFGAGIYITSTEWITVVGNTLYNTNVSTVNSNLAPGAIGINGTSCFTIQGNIIRSPVWYGIYIVGDGNLLGSGLIQGNVITGCITHAGIRINTTNNVSVIANSVQGVAAQDDGIVVASGGTTLVGISVLNNKVSGFSGSGINGIHITYCQCPKITGNYSSGNTIGYTVDLCAGGDFSGNEAHGSSTYDGFFGASNTGPIFFDRNTFVSTATNGVQDSSGALYYGINNISGQTNQFVTGYAPVGRTLATSATPSVANQVIMYYGGATAVTDLLNPTPNQRLTIIATGNCTFDHNAGAATTKILLSGATNFSMVANNTLTLEYQPNGPWIEIGRKV